MMQPESEPYTQFATVHEQGTYGSTLHVFGDIDMSTAPALEAAIADASTGDAAVIVNFGKCRYLDSSGLTVLVRSRKRIGSRLHIIVSPASSVLRVLQVAGLDRVLSVVTELSTTA